MRKDVEIVAGALEEAHAGWSKICEPGRPTWEAVAKELLDKGMIACAVPLKHVLTLDPPQVVTDRLKIVHNFGSHGDLRIQAFDEDLNLIWGWEPIETKPDYVVMPRTGGIKISKVVIIG